MQVWINPDGTRAVPWGTPYIDQSELQRNVQLYSPYEYQSVGLYDRTQPLCQTFKTGTYQFMKKNNNPLPNSYVTNNGWYIRPFSPN